MGQHVPGACDELGREDAGKVEGVLTPSNCVQCGAITAKGGRLLPAEGGAGTGVLTDVSGPEETASDLRIAVPPGGSARRSPLGLLRGRPLLFLLGVGAFSPTMTRSRSAAPASSRPRTHSRKTQRARAVLKVDDVAASLPQHELARSRPATSSSPTGGGCPASARSRGRVGVEHLAAGALGEERPAAQGGLRLSSPRRARRRHRARSAGLRDDAAARSAADAEHDGRARPLGRPRPALHAPAHSERDGSGRAIRGHNATACTSATCGPSRA